MLRLGLPLAEIKIETEKIAKLTLPLSNPLTMAIINHWKPLSEKQYKNLKNHPDIEQVFTDVVQ